jgi:hypothetical protein
MARNMEPLKEYFSEEFGRVRVKIENGHVRFQDMDDRHTVYMSEEDLGFLFDKWMLARLRQFKDDRKEGKHAAL